MRRQNAGIIIVCVTCPRFALPAIPRVGDPCLSFRPLLPRIIGGTAVGLLLYVGMAFANANGRTPGQPSQAEEVSLRYTTHNPAEWIGQKAMHKNNNITRDSRDA